MSINTRGHEGGYGSSDLDRFVRRMRQTYTVPRDPIPTDVAARVATTLAAAYAEARSDVHASDADRVATMRGALLRSAAEAGQIPRPARLRLVGSSRRGETADADTDIDAAAATHVRWIVRTLDLVFAEQLCKPATHTTTVVAQNKKGEIMHDVIDQNAAGEQAFHHHKSPGDRRSWADLSPMEMANYRRIGVVTPIGTALIPIPFLPA